jgi:FkbM family methyltransferase
MTERVFVDVGGYHGHSSLAALDPIFGFDRVICFEPDPTLAAGIRRICDPRLKVIEVALSDRDGEADLVGGGQLGASIVDGYTEVFGEVRQTVQTRNAADFLGALIPEGSFVRMKLNCEGSELFIAETLTAKRMTWLLD